MTTERLRKMEVCRHLLPDPAPQIVGELLNELKAAQDCMMHAWEVIANAGQRQGGWESQSDEWQKAAIRWHRDWLEVMSDTPKDDIAPREEDIKAGMDRFEKK